MNENRPATFWVYMSQVRGQFLLIEKWGHSVPRKLESADLSNRASVRAMELVRCIRAVNPEHYAARNASAAY